MVPRHTGRGIILRGESILLIERWRGDMHYFSVPGGGIEAGETPEQTCLREITEETGCMVTIARKLYVLTLPEGSQHHIFLCSYQTGEPHLPADSPEAIERDPDNRFEPGWIPVEWLDSADFLVWEPIRTRLLHDLRHGFQKTVAQLTADVVR